MNKQELRSFALLRRKTLTINKSYLIREVKKRIENSKNVAIYYPMQYEIDLLFLKNEKINLIYPKVEGKSLVFYKDVTIFKKSKFNVFEPGDGIVVDSADIDIMFVPALVINPRKYRIGYGKGYYDKYLKDNKVKTVGLVYEELYLDFDENELDERLDDIIICKQ